MGCSIFCMQCAEAQERLVREISPEFPGEFSKLVYGKLGIPEARCDNCNLELIQGTNVCAYSTFGELEEDRTWEGEFLDEISDHQVIGVDKPTEDFEGDFVPPSLFTRLRFFVRGLFSNEG